MYGYAKSDYCDNGIWYVDAYDSEDAYLNDCDGISVAHIDELSLEVTYTIETAKISRAVRKAVGDKLMEILRRKQESGKW